LYEAYGKHGDVKLELKGAVSRVVETDLMENEGEQLPLKDGKVNIHFRPFEIKTLKIE
jgi:alpha-mannosidase